MKTRIPYLLFLLIITIVVSPFLKVSAQPTEEEFRSEKYALAISEIVDQSNGKLDREAVIQQLLGSITAKVKVNPSTTLFRGDLMITPMIDFIGYDGSDSARFSYLTTETPAADLILDFENNLTWVDTLSPVMTDDSIKINVDGNPTHEARLASFTVEAQFAGDTSIVTVWIIQEPLPQKIIYASPKYCAIPPEGATTSIFTINYFNIVAWEAVIPVNWISINDATHYGSPDSVSFTVQANSTASFREAYIKINESGNPAVSDSIHIYQYAGSQEFLIASPPNNYINPDGGNIDVQVFSNIAWEALELSNPGNMISNISPTSSTGSGTLIITVSQNTTTDPRTAQVIISGGDPLLSDTITINQNGAQEQYLIASPIENYIEPGGGTINVQVFSNVAWTPTTVINPVGMITQLIKSPDSTFLTIVVSANQTVNPRNAEIKITGGNPLLIATIHIYQFGSLEQYLIASPITNYIEPMEGDVEIQVYSNIEWTANTISSPNNMITNLPQNYTGSEVLLIHVSKNTTTEPRTAQVIISGDDPLLSDTITIYQSAAYLLLSPGEKVLPDAESTFGVDVIRYFVDSINFEPDSSIWFTISIINNDSLSVAVGDNSSDTVRVAKVTVTSASNPSIGDTLNIFQYPANQPYIILSPTMQSVAWNQETLPEPFTIVSNNIVGFTVTSTEPSWANPTLSDNEVSVVISVNSSIESRTAKIIVSDASKVNVADTVDLIQGGAPSYIEISPKFQSVSFAGGTLAPFEVEVMNVPLWEVFFESGKPDWITFVDTTGGQVVFTLLGNPENSTRQATFRVRDISNTARYDEAIILQEAAPAPYLFVSPREQAVAHTGNLMVDFVVTRVNVASWAFTDTLTSSEWINFFNVGDSILRLSIDTNFLPETRQASILIHATNDTLVADTVSIYQYSALDQYLLAAPREKVVDFPGDTIAFHITSVNVTGWLVDTNSLPDWISEGEHTSDTMSLIIDGNDSIVSRNATIKFFASNNPGIMDSVSVFQYAGQDAFLLAAPREQWAIHLNDTLTFDVTAVNVQAWSVDNNTLPDWIGVGSTTISQMKLNIEPNNSAATRQAIVRLFVNDQPDIYDSVYVYQYSSLDTFLLAAPREQWASHLSDNLTYDVTAVNVQLWSVETNTLPNWISVGSTTISQMNLNIEPNNSAATRQALVRLFVNEHPDIYDSVFVYQYSALDTFLLAAPREQWVAHTGNENLVFDVTTVNVEAWEVETVSLPDWISVAGTTLSQMTLAVDTNEFLSSRQAMVRLFVTGHPDIYDSVFIYQYSALDTFLLAAPREQWVAHTGNENLVFDVTTVNVEAWEVEMVSLPDWISVAGTTLSQMTLTIDTNEFLSSRQALVRLFVTGHPDFYDSVYVYQYSALDTFLLAAPREQWVAHTGNENLVFDVTTVNVEAWEVETVSLPDWISVAGTTLSQMTLAVDTNEFLSSRQAMVRLFVTGHPDIYDSVFIYQYSALDTFLLAAPREQWVAHTGNENLVFDVTTVNVEAWEVEMVSLPDWISVAGTTLSQMTLAIDTNEFLSSRQAMVRIFVTSHLDFYDSVFVYQYSALDTFLLASPREQHVQFTGNTINFHITKVNVNDWVVDPDLLPDWIELGTNNPDTLHLNILMNTTLQTRDETIYLFDPDNPETKDSVSVYQFAAEDPYILLAPREQRVSHLGNEAVEFDVTLVNVDEWEFADTTIYEDWIDFQNLENKMLLTIDTNNLLEARYANIVIRSVSNPLVKDSVSIYQYSGLDQYILIEPHEQLAKRYSGDTLYFEIIKVNVAELGFEVFDLDGMIDLENTSITNDTLAVYVNLNTSPDSRQAYVKVFDPDSPDEVYDSVSVYQNFPYIILRPSAIDSLDWTGTVTRIESYSNVAQYTVSKGETSDWYQISSDSASWTNFSIELAGDDRFYMRVDTNNNSYLRRSSLLEFEITSQIATEFWFDQDTRPGKFYPVSGQVFVQNDPQQPLPGVSVVLYDSIVKTNYSGIYEYQKVPENWIGTITPLIDTGLTIPYYFLPPRIEISGLGIIDTTQVDAFAAYKIDPAVTLAPESTSICYGQSLLPGDPGYPSAVITDTYGSSTYLWIADPPDSLLAINPNALTPDFKPKVTTTYRLEVNNFFRTAVDYFTIVVNQLPDAFDFEGEHTVCENQAGVIYQVTDPKPGVYYKWELEASNPGGVFANSSLPYSVSGNIALVNWGDNPGNYVLHLIAYNEYDCGTDPVSKNITIANTEAPPPTTVLRKENDNMLYCTDTLAKSYQWGWLQKNATGELVQEYFIPGKGDWYCRLPEGHNFDPSVYYYFVITYFDENVCGSRSFLNVPVAIDELPNENVTIFPNPGNGVFTIRFGREINTRDGEIEVYNVSGQMIFHQNLVAIKNDENIDLSVNDPGIYLLIVRTPGNLFNTKIIIQ